MSRAQSETSRPESIQKPQQEAKWETQPLTVTFNRRRYDTNEPVVETVDILAIDTKTLPTFPENWVKTFRITENTRFHSWEPVPCLYGLETNGVLRLWTTQHDPIPMHSEVERALQQAEGSSIRLQLTNTTFEKRKVQGEEKPPKLSQTIELHIPPSIPQAERETIEQRYRTFLKPITSPPKETEFFYELETLFVVENTKA